MTKAGTVAPHCSSLAAATSRCAPLPLPLRLIGRPRAARAPACARLAPVCSSNGGHGRKCCVARATDESNSSSGGSGSGGSGSGSSGGGNAEQQQTAEGAQQQQQQEQQPLKEERPPPPSRQQSGSSSGSGSSGGLGDGVDDMLNRMAPKRAGDTADVVLMALSAAALVALSAQLYRGYLLYSMFSAQRGFEDAPW